MLKLRLVSVCLCVSVSKALSSGGWLLSYILSSLFALCVPVSASVCFFLCLCLSLSVPHVCFGHSLRGLVVHLSYRKYRMRCMVSLLHAGEIRSFRIRKLGEDALSYQFHYNSVILYLPNCVYTCVSVLTCTSVYFRLRIH